VTTDNIYFTDYIIISSPSTHTLSSQLSCQSPHIAPAHIQVVQMSA
jgi:hypothetical protein